MIIVLHFFSFCVRIPSNLVCAFVPSPTLLSPRQWCLSWLSKTPGCLKHDWFVPCPGTIALLFPCPHWPVFTLFCSVLEYTWAFRPWYRRWHNLLCELTLNTREENQDEIGRHWWHHILTLIYFHSQVQSSYLSDSILKPQCENSLI